MSLDFRSVVEKYISKIRPDESYLDVSGYDPSRLREVVSQCIDALGGAVDESSLKMFMSCVKARLNSEMKVFDSAVVKCYSAYRRGGVDSFLSCLYAEIERAGSRVRPLLDYCVASLKVGNKPRDVYDCVLSGLEAIYEATKRAVREYRQLIKNVRR